MSVAMLYQGMAVVAFRELFESLLLSQFCGRYGYERGRIATNSSLEPPGMGSSSSSSRIAPLGLAIFSASSAHVSRRGTAHFFRKRRRIRAETWTENGGLSPIPPPPTTWKVLCSGSESLRWLHLYGSFGETIAGGRLRRSRERGPRGPPRRDGPR